MLFGHLLNRGALPHVHMQLGAAAREAVAIEEWMGASPIYTRRMRRCLGFEGDDVGTIFKGFQLDVGFPHQYMDVCYRLEDERRGTFWLRSCGALLEVEQYGEAAVRSMCHAIEDPTFDASAVATNPPAMRARRQGAALPVGALHRSRRRAHPGGRHHPPGACVAACRHRVSATGGRYGGRVERLRAPLRSLLPPREPVACRAAARVS